MRKVLVIGASSAIAEAAARIFAHRGDELFLVGRRTQSLNLIAADLQVRGASSVYVETMDGADLTAHEAMLRVVEERLGFLDVVLIAYGTLSDQIACESSAELTASELHNNAVSVAALLTRIATRLKERRAGTIVVISSVAGDRGRQSNYVYGSAKALLTVFLSGLRQRLHKSGVSVITVKPGFVDTPMTARFAKGILWATPHRIASGIVSAVDRSATVIYLPGFWRPIMFVVRLIPERIFQRLKL
jgi:decaprenylphospho-beta-D-erythro-pentofuranosid-2-ulose 2-reductase